MENNTKLVISKNPIGYSASTVYGCGSITINSNNTLAIKNQPSPYKRFCIKLRPTVQEYLPDLTFQQVSKYLEFLWKISPDMLKKEFAEEGTTFDYPKLTEYEQKFQDIASKLSLEYPKANFVELYFIHDPNVLNYPLEFILNN